MSSWTKFNRQIPPRLRRAFCITVWFRRDTSAVQSRRARRGRPGLTVNTVGLIAVGFPAANSLSRIFVRIGYRLNGLPYTIPDSMPGSLDCAARGLQPPGYSVVTIYFRSE